MCSWNKKAGEYQISDSSWTAEVTDLDEYVFVVRHRTGKINTHRGKYVVKLIGQTIKAKK
jgi:hypothetical protein